MGASTASQAGRRPDRCSRDTTTSPDHLGTVGAGDGDLLRATPLRQELTNHSSQLDVGFDARAMAARLPSGRTAATSATARILRMHGTDPSRLPASLEAGSGIGSRTGVVAGRRRRQARAASSSKLACGGRPHIRFDLHCAPGRDQASIHSVERG